MAFNFNFNLATGPIFGVHYRYPQRAASIQRWFLMRFAPTGSAILTFGYTLTTSYELPF